MLSCPSRIINEMVLRGEKVVAPSDLFETVLPEEKKKKNEQSFVKVSISPSGVVAFSTTKDEKDSVSSKELSKIFK